MRRWLLAALLVPSIARAQPVEPAPADDASSSPTAPPVEPPPSKLPAVPVIGRRLDVHDDHSNCHHEPNQPLWPELRHQQCSERTNAFARWSNTFALDLELVTQARYTSKAGDNLSELRLDRGEAGARIGFSDYGAAELRVEAIRSASDGGALGIDGDSTVLRVKYANVSGHLETSGVELEGALGFVPDPWIHALETSYSLEPLSRTGSERLLGWQTADLSAMVRASYGPTRLTLTIGNGEGQSYPERNNGKTTTGVLEVVPLHTTDGHIRLFAMGRDGSVGPARIRDRRIGGGATAVFEPARAGFEVVKAWGIADRGDAEGLELGGWAETNLGGIVYSSARYSRLSFDAGGHSSTFGGAISVGDARTFPNQLRLWLAIDRITSSGSAMPLPGADAADSTQFMIIASGNATFAPSLR